MAAWQRGRAQAEVEFTRPRGTQPPQKVGDDCKTTALIQNHKADPSRGALAWGRHADSPRSRGSRARRRRRAARWCGGCAYTAPASVEFHLYHGKVHHGCQGQADRGGLCQDVQNASTDAAADAAAHAAADAKADAQADAAADAQADAQADADTHAATHAAADAGADAGAAV